MLSGRGVRHVLLDFNSYDSTDTIGIFPRFLKRTADVLTTCLRVVCRRLVRLGSSGLAGDRPMSPQLLNLQRLPLLPLTDRFL